MPFHVSTPSPADLRNILPASVSIPAYKSFYHISGYRHPLLPVLTAQQPHAVKMMNWGLIPHDTATLGAAKAAREKTLNARAETLFSAPFFYNYAPHNRCLIFVNGFFDWKQKGKHKIPCFIHLPGKAPFALAGLYAQWSHPDLYGDFGCSMITTEARGLMSLISNIKNRMPLILPVEQWQTWLNTSEPIASVQQLLQAHETSDLQAYQVSDLLSSTGFDTNIPEIHEKTADLTIDEDDFFF